VKKGGLLLQVDTTTRVPACACAALYRTYIEERLKWESTVATAKAREAEALARADGLSSKAARLDELTSRLETPGIAAGAGECPPPRARTLSHV